MSNTNIDIKFDENDSAVDECGEKMSRKSECDESLTHESVESIDESNDTPGKPLCIHYAFGMCAYDNKCNKDHSYDSNLRVALMLDADPKFLRQMAYLKEKKAGDSMAEAYALKYGHAMSNVAGKAGRSGKQNFGNGTYADWNSGGAFGDCNGRSGYFGNGTYADWNGGYFGNGHADWNGRTTHCGTFGNPAYVGTTNTAQDWFGKGCSGFACNSGSASSSAQGLNSGSASSSGLVRNSGSASSSGDNSGFARSSGDNSGSASSSGANSGFARSSGLGPSSGQVCKVEEP
jgi:hypothetical protein